MERMIPLVQRMRRRMLFAVLAAALVVALLPAAAFASGNGGRMNYPTYQNARHGQYSKQYNRRNYNYNWNNQYNHSSRNNYTHKQNNYDRNDNWRYEHQNSNKHYNRCANSYHVRRGDTLSEIARHYHTSVYALAKGNGIRNANRIVAGQTLCIP